MKPLASWQILVASSAADSFMRTGVEALQQAGASVRSCALGQDLWALVSEGGLDLCLLFVAQPDAGALGVYEQLRQHERTRNIPNLLVARELTAGTGRAAAVIWTDLDAATFVEEVRSVLQPVRRLRELGAQHRTQREALRRETALARRVARDQVEFGHELRSMLDAIMGFACNLRDEVAGPMLTDQKAHVAGILDAIERAARLLDRARGRAVVALSGKPSSDVLVDAQRAQRSLVHLAYVADDVVALLDVMALRKSLRLRCVRDETVSVWGDALKLKQVVTNLVVNALKYTPCGGEVLLRVAWTTSSIAQGRPARRAAEISVSDTGPGIAPEYRERIFRRGFRIDAAADVEGEGIGLAVVKDIVSQHGGTVAVGGDRGQGATFTVLLPQDRRQRISDPKADPAI